MRRIGRAHFKQCHLAQMSSSVRRLWTVDRLTVLRACQFLRCQDMENDTNSDNITSIFDQGLHPYKLQLSQVIFRCAAISAGVPLNVFVAAVLIFSRELHNARNIIWLGVALSNLSHLLSMPVEFWVQYAQSYLACQIIQVVGGKTYLFLLINLFLAACDRLMYTKWPQFHQKHVTVFRVIITQVTCCSFAFLALTYQFWLLHLPIRCGLDLKIVTVYVALVNVLTWLCIALKVIIFFSARKSYQERDGIATRAIALPSLDDTKDRPESSPSVSPMHAHSCSRRMKQMEWRATMTLVASLIPLCLFTVISLLYVGSRKLCLSLYGHCDVFETLQICVRELGVLHVCTNLLVYIFRSLEFRAAVSKWWRR